MGLEQKVPVEPAAHGELATKRSESVTACGAAMRRPRFSRIPIERPNESIWFLHAEIPGKDDSLNPARIELGSPA